MIVTIPDVEILLILPPLPEDKGEMRDYLKKEQNRTGRLPLTWTYLEPEAGEVSVCKTIMNLQLARAVLKEIHGKSPMTIETEHLKHVGQYGSDRCH